MGSKQYRNDQEGINAIDALEILVKKAEKEMVWVEAIVLSPNLVAEGYIFITETFDYLFYILVNQSDWDKAIAYYEMTNEGKDNYVDPYAVAQNAVNGVPVVTDQKTIQKAVSGVYKWTYVLPSASPRKKTRIYSG